MKHSFDSSDDRLFDRLVDGELSDNERRALLQSLESSPEGWRRCALAFLESQALSDSLREVVREPAVGEAANSIDAVPVAALSRREVRTRRNAWQRPAAWLAVAASLFIAVSLAISQRDQQRGLNDAAGQTNMAASAVDPVPEQSPSGANDEDVLTFWVRDEAGRSRPLRVPLIDAEPLDRELGMAFQSGVTDQLRSKLQDRGYDVQSRRRYAPLMLENGRRMILPVEDTRIVPVSQEVY